jgi:hypothetical protein
MEDNIRKGLTEIEWEGLKWVRLAQWDQWRDSCEYGNEYSASIKCRIPWLAEWLSASEEGICSTELVS